MNFYNQQRGDTPLFLLVGKTSYYDSPEGTNPWQKIWGLGKFVPPTAIAVSLFDALFHSRASNIIEVANVAAYWTLPMLGLTTSFASVTYIAANLRGVDDKKNYILGALACAPVLQAWWKSTESTIWGVSTIMALALIKKHSMDKGWVLLPDVIRYAGDYDYNLSLIKEEWPRRPL